MFQIRTYKDGDEEELSGLFNDFCGDYAGFVPRTPEFWLWCCRNRPGVQDEGIIIAEADGEVIGYAVVSCSGEILELCYRRKHDEEEVVSKLLESVEGYVTKVRAGRITLNAPIDDYVIRRTCGKLGYAESTPPYAFQLSIIDFPGLVREILLSKLERVKTWVNGEISLRIRQSSSMDGERLTLKILSNDVFLEEKEVTDPRFTIEASKQVFASCLFGSMNLLRAVLTGKIKIHPLWRVLDSLNFLSLLKIDDPWYVPFADHG